MSWIILALSSRAIFAGNNFVDQFLVEKRIKNPGVLTVFAGWVMLIFGLVILALVHFPVFPFEQTILLLVSGMLVGISILPYFAALAIDEASRVVPFFQTIPIFVLLLSYIFLRELPLPQQFIGVGAIVAGAFLLSIKEFNWNLFRLRKSLGYMLLSSFCIAASFVLFRFVVIHQSFWPSLGYDLAGEGLGGVALLLLSRYRLSSWQELKNTSISTSIIFVVNQTIYTVGLFFSYKAISLAPVALVSALGGVQPFFVLLFGVILSIWFPKIAQEDIRQSTLVIKVLSIIFIFIGVWFIYH